MRTESKILAGACAGLYFFLSAFYFKVDEGLQEISKINTTLAVAVAEMKGLDNRITKVEDENSEIKKDVKKLSNGFINLETRVGYLESAR